MRRKATFLVTLWWVILCGVVGACMLLFANRDPVVSEEENRTLAGLPKLTLQAIQEGEISASFEQFLSDQFFLRSEMVDGATALKHVFSALTVDDLLGEEGDEVFVPARDLTDTSEGDTPSTNAAAEQLQAGADLTEPDTAENATPAGGSASVWLDHKDGTKSALFTYSEEEIQRTADTLNAYAALLPSGGKLHVLIAPRAQTANKLALHLDTESGWYSTVEPTLQTLVNKNIVVHSAYDILQNSIISGEYIYFRTDHHWTARGAYLAANAMLGSEGYQTVPLSDYQEKSISGYLGSIYLHARNAKLKDLTDTIEVFYPLLPAQSYRVSNTYKKGALPVIDEAQTNYLVFLGGTYGPYRLLEGGYQTGRNMLMICDSFGNSIAPFFLPYYDNVYMVDFRDEYYTREEARGSVKDYIRRCGINDIYIVLSETNGIGSAYIDRMMPANME
ncbi:hypothetical protein SDC9_97462 [bioreactor metagenome]|uniref:AlgX/AlgJ SGNH hydrolase-like domain-containing protein n=1 Tax=bioreactor metagenome TaxID=1076179 RepID=A0A645AC21_9ZZZZ